MSTTVTCVFNYLRTFDEYFTPNHKGLYGEPVKNTPIQTIESRLSALESAPVRPLCTDRDLLGIMSAIILTGWDILTRPQPHDAYIEARRLLEIVDHNLREERQAEHDKQKAQKRLQRKPRPRAQRQTKEKSRRNDTGKGEATIR